MCWWYYSHHKAPDSLVFVIYESRLNVSTTHIVHFILWSVMVLELLNCLDEIRGIYSLVSPGVKDISIISYASPKSTAQNGLSPVAVCVCSSVSETCMLQSVALVASPEAAGGTCHAGFENAKLTATKSSNTVWRYHTGSYSNIYLTLTQNTNETNI